jgi:uncharacterized Zn finger protein
MTDEGQQFTFLVQGSSADPYEVTVFAKAKSITAFCTCHAGQMGQACKHRLAILSGVAASVVSENSDQVKAVAAFVHGTPLGKSLHDLAVAELTAEHAKATLAAAKKAVARAMSKS